MSTTRILTGLGDILGTTRRVLTSVGNIIKIFPTQTRKSNFELEQGADFFVNIPVYNTDGSIFNLTGWTPTGTMSKSYYDNPTDFINLSISVYNAPSGILSWVFSGSNSLNVAPGHYVFNIDIVQGDLKNRILKGILKVNPGVNSNETYTGAN